jgi:hypothetical protein
MRTLRGCLGCAVILAFCVAVWAGVVALALRAGG